MSGSKDAALKGVDSGLSDAVARICETYEVCLIDANNDAAKEAECKAIRDRSLAYARRAHADMQAAVSQQWPSE
jgi:hypothetical protein